MILGRGTSSKQLIYRPLAVGVAMMSRGPWRPCWCTICVHSKPVCGTMVICAIVGCGNRSKTDKEKSFFRVHNTRVCSDHFLDATNKLSCRRDVLYSNFDGYERVFTQSLCMCCDLCSKLCDCNKCAEKHNTFVFLKK